ncbi:glycosyltransferase [Massilia rhizosphaerae]|uniref:glycosyltransferase n=1 Tax=Massilia rhizosphaerae TaxID=2784389 RepID=UPI0018DB625A|nr:glycosyltransferase [Massilia rhizosphaerae]
MVIVNFYNLKNTNGLYYYALDYIKNNQNAILKVLVRPHVASNLRTQFPDLCVVECNFIRFVIEVVQGCVRGDDLLYTPTPHPLPFISTQFIVLHDPYPFFGNLGKLKKFLLRLSLSTSRCLVGHINRSDAKDFLIDLGVSDERQFFAPNIFPAMLGKRHSKRDVYLPRLRIGLVGTDSPKKNYEGLFAATLKAGHGDLFEFRIYGHKTSYLAGLGTEFGTIRQELVESDQSTLEGFLDSVDVVVSVATNEGFGRPLAAALTAGVPCFLLESRVFREFFDGAAHFRKTIDEIVSLLAAMQKGQILEQVNFEVPLAVVDAQRNIERTVFGASR